MKCLKNAGSINYNYKNFFSIVLMAIADADYKFVMIDVGAYGKDSDGGELHNSRRYHSISNGSIKSPNNNVLLNSNISTPFVFIEDKAFPFSEFLITP